MVRNAEDTARAAEADDYNLPGYCLQQCRQWADIPARYGTASFAWFAVDRPQRDRNPPRGAFVFWTGGSKGYGHIAVSLGNGLVRSTDAGGTGRVATRTIAWFEVNWPSQNYVGWADNVNGVTVPGVIDTRDGFDMADLADLRTVVDARVDPLEQKVDALDRKIETLLERTEGLRLTHNEIVATLDALVEEVSDDATKAQVQRARDRVIEALSFPGESQ